MTDSDYAFELIEAKWNLLEDCLPLENGAYVVTVDVAENPSDKLLWKIGLCAFVDGEWYSTMGALAVIEPRRIHKWYSIAIPDPYKQESS